MTASPGEGVASPHLRAPLSTVFKLWVTNREGLAVWTRCCSNQLAMRSSLARVKAT